MSTQPKMKSLILRPHEVRNALKNGGGQFRRVVKPQPISFNGRNYQIPDDSPKKWLDYDGPFVDLAPLGQPGDRLYVRETFIEGYKTDDMGNLITTDSNGDDVETSFWYRANGEPDFAWLDEDGFVCENTPWKSSSQMPRRASRLTLEITAVRVERVQEIKCLDAKAEGFEGCTLCTEGRGTCSVGGLHPFTKNFNSRAKPGEKFEDNPWVWVGEYKVVEGEV